jgi:dipeptidyl aminopeptidase/acylaminoacyl peptidase
VLNADGTGLRRVTNGNQDRHPAWSPDGGRIAFTRADGTLVRLFVVNADGTGLTGVTNDVNVQDPEWSPDGSRFTFSDGGRVYVVNADGTGLTLLTAGETTASRYPSWSPDGTLIAFASAGAVKVVAPDGSGLRTLIGGLREVWEVSWSPDGRQLAFVNDAAGPLQEELWVANADGSNVRRLNVDTETDLDWGRLGAVPPPVAGVSVNVAPVSGVVRVRVRGTNRFVSLARLSNVPVGSEVDVTRGRIRLVSAAGAGRTQTGTFFQGRGIVRQARGRLPVTTLQVSGPLVCPRRSTAGAEQRRPPRTRRLWGDARGRFRTQGRFATATVRGTVWLTEDRCDGTLIRVRTGRVQVRDIVRRRTVNLRAGQSYLARRR